MAKWVVVRVAARDGQTAQQVLARTFAPVTMSINMHPPAAGPEWEIRVKSLSEREVCGALGDMVLASKTELAPPA